VLREKAPEVYSESLLEMNMFDLLDRFMESEAMKVFYCSISWFSGAAPHWEGMAIPSFGGAALMYYGSLAIPHNGMHHYAHAIVRCALAYGARVFTCCPVDEIIVENGVAVGVRLRETAVRAEKTIRARKAVISAVPVQKTFLDLISPRHTDISFRQRVKDISLKGGSLYVAHILMRGMPTYTPRFAKDKGTDLPAFVGHYPCDSRELFLGHVADIDARKTTPTLDLDKLFVGGGIGHNHLEEPGRVPADHWLFTPVYMQVPAPEYHVAGPEAVNKMKADVNAAILRAYSEVIANVNADTLAGYWANSPYDSELRNTGMIAGNWYATAHSLDQWAERRPLPELARYRTPIDGLYLCHQTSHPGGLCLMAVPYNLMHILIEDGIAQPGAWWYPSPHYIAEQRAPRATVSI